jgi:serine/threonine-protein kinase
VATTTKRPAGRRRGLSLATRIFLLSAVLILLSVGSAVVVTFVLGQRIARSAIHDALAASHAQQASGQQQRFELLKAMSNQAVLDVNFQAAIAEALPTGDVLSVLDQLGERQTELGFDFGMVLDPQGLLAARTDQPTATGQDLSRRPLVAVALRDNEAAGVWQEGDDLYDAVAVPLIKDFILQGFLVAGYAINDVRALQVKRTSGTEVAYLASTPNGPVVAAATLDAGMARRLMDGLRAQGGVLRRVMDESQAVPQIELDLEGRRWIALVAPLRDAAGKSVGASVALASFDEAFASYRDIGTVLVVVGVVSMLLAFALSYLLSRRTLRPVRQLVAAAQAARLGDYDQRIGVDRGDEVGKLARAFDVLLADLREKRDMEAYVAELSRNLPDAGPGHALVAPSVRAVTLMGVELRGYANRRVAVEPQETLDRLSRDLRRLAAAVASHHGRLLGSSGQRALALFDGEGRSFDALAAGAEVLAGLSVRESAFDAADPPAVALASGEAVQGSVVFAESPDAAVVGLPVQQLEGLLREAAPGDLVLGQTVKAELQDAFQRAGVEVYPQRGVLSGQPLFVLSAEVAARITGVELQAQTLAAPAGAGASHATLAGIAPGQLVGERFQILSVLGAGGMGVVYKARDRELDDLVALKMLKREVADDTGLLERLKSELKLARKITHPNVLRTFDFGEVNGLPYISMEYVRGITLRYLLDREGRLPYSAGLRLAKQLCAGLGAAHAGGVIHRDIKPENLILDHAGNAKLMDFGIARPAKRLAGGQTQAGLIVGTPEYLAPEQLEGKEADHRADIYACGCVFYEMFTGHLPFTGDNPMQVILKHMHEAPLVPSVHWSEIPRELERIILKCLEKDPAKRYRDVRALQADLEQLTA